MHEEIEKKEARIYEASFLLLPSLSQDQALSVFSEIKNQVENLGGVYISEEAPYPRALAYEMTRSVDTKKKKFSDAYFGWVKFEIEPEGAEKISEWIASNENIIRSLVIKTVRENTYISKNDPAERVLTDESTSSEGSVLKGSEELVAQ